MQIVENVFSPLSYKAQWQKEAIPLTEKSFHNVAISDLSYEIMLKFGDKIHKEKRWADWKVSIERQFGKMEGEDLTTYALAWKMIGHGFRLQNLDNMAEKMGDSSVRKCFYNDVQSINYGQEDSRRQADMDASMGYLKDISERALEGIADLMKAHDSWRTMGDALGFSLGECLGFKDPLALLKGWGKKFPEGTLKRIYFEAERLGFTDVCEYLNAIPLQGFSEIEITDPYAQEPDNRPTTIFDMIKLDEVYDIQIDWQKVSMTLGKSCKDGIWMSCDVTLWSLSSTLNGLYKDHSHCFDQFMQEIRLGNFEPKNSKEVTYNQIAYLAKKKSIGYPEKFKSIHKVLSVQMQKEDLDLHGFVQKMEKEFLPYGSGLELYYERMVPKRHYSPFIANENKKKIEKV